MAILGSVTSKGQTTIPKEIRERLGLETGTRIEWSIEDGMATLKPRKIRAIDLAGILHRSGTKPLSIQEMDAGIMDAVAEDDERIMREWHEGRE
jgi:antitoxin PrlF